MVVCAMLCCVNSTAAERAESFEEALSKAGSDGVVVYCYGPDWNTRSVRLLKSFWNSPEAEEAACNAVMLAIPFYENEETPEAEKAKKAQGKMPRPDYMVCPSVMMFRKDGSFYAELQGSDYLGTDDKCSLGCKNMRDKIHALREQQKLLHEAEAEPDKAKKAALLAKAAEFPIRRPMKYLEGRLIDIILEGIRKADPQDKAGYYRRLTFEPRNYLVELMELQNGFLKHDFEPDMKKIRRRCEAIFKDKTLRAQDRQAVYNIYIGQSRRAHEPGSRLRGMIRKSQKLDENSIYGQLSPALIKLWGNLKHRPSADERKKESLKKREKARKERDQKRAERNIQFN